jgi:hypothetical protein
MNPRAEMVGAAATGALLAGAVGSLVGLTVPAAIVGACNGAVAGRRQVYDWSSPTGIGAFALDSTWALSTTAAGLAAQAIGELRGESGYVSALRRRQNRQVFERGFQTRRGFAITVGNVISGAGDTRQARRTRLVTDHEDVHVWQARWFGPAYPVLYVGWMVGGGIAGVIAWVAGGRRRHRCAELVEACGYYLNPFEWWAYSRDGHWPPNGLASGLGWKQPAVASFSSRRA